LCLWALAACSDVTLASGLSERDAKDLGAELNRRGVAVTQRADGAGYVLQVSESAVPLAWQAARTQCAQLQPQPTAAPALFSTRETELRAEEKHLEARIGSAIEALPNVHSAAVLITLGRPENKLTELRAPPAASAPRAVVSLVCEGHGSCPVAEQLHALLSAAVPGLTSSNIRVLQETQRELDPACAELGHVGPLTVTRESLPTLKLWFAASLVVHMLGSLALLLVVQRRRRAALKG
jgi:type III secretory pathway lipoprotein EscJ